MSNFQQDYILRLMEKIGFLIARIIGLKEAGELEEALQEIEKAGTLFPGISPELLAKIDSSTTAQLLEQSEYITAYARLMAEKASIQRQMGHNQEAQSNEKRALELLLESYKQRQDPTKEFCGLIDLLVSQGATKELSGAYQELLKKVCRE